MKAEDLSRMMGATLITFVIALAALSPAFMDATDEGGPARKIENPKLAVNGVEFRLAAVDNRTFKEGEEPEFVLTAVNTTDQPAAATIETLMNSTTRNPSRMSRQGPRAVTIWQEPRTLSLGPRETKTVIESTHTRVPADTKVDVYLRRADTALNSPADLVSMLSFSTVLSPPAPQ